MNKNCNYTNLACALIDCQTALSKDPKAKVTLILRKYGYTDIFRETVVNNVCYGQEIDETLAQKVREENNELRKQRRTEKQKAKTSKKASADDLRTTVTETRDALPLKDITSADPLNAYEPRELMENLRKRGYKGELRYDVHYTKTVIIKL